jgi:hypothetical protein
MNNNTQLAIDFIYLLVNKKLSDGKSLLESKLSMNELFKTYTILAFENKLGTSKGAFEKGIFYILTSYHILNKRSSLYTFSSEHFKEFEEQFGDKENKKVKK